MLKAFLCHSSLDKHYVDIVARRLNRSRVILDRLSFAPGQDFRDAIRKGLDQSGLFVLFASENSLKSDWVKFEIDEAEIRKISGQLKSVLTICIDPTLDIKKLPEWMRRGRIIIQTKPRQAARVMMSQLLFYEGKEYKPLFVGREELLQEIAKELVPAGGAPSPQVLIASGLPGVGRRTVMERVLLDNLSLPVGPVFMLEDTDGIDKLYFLLLDETEELTSRSELAKLITAFHGADTKQKASLIGKEIDRIAIDNVAIVIVDDGALTREDGQYRTEVEAILELLAASAAEPYVVIVQRFRPPLVQLKFFSKYGAASFAVPPLQFDATKRLLAQSLKSAGVEVGSDSDLDELTRYVDGYPPAVSLATSFATRYGLSSLLAEKSSLVDLKVRAFGRLLKRLSLSDKEQLVLRVLGMESTFSLDALSTLTDIDTTELAHLVRKLIDQSLVVQNSGRFSLAAPIRDTVYREFGMISAEEYAKFASILKSRYWSKPDEVPPLEIIDATIYSLGRGNLQGQLRDFLDIVLPSNLLKIATGAYHERQWKTARDFAERTTKADPSLEQAWIILAKALVRLAHEGAAEWHEAEAVLEQVRKRATRGYFYLVGFKEWKKGNLHAAIKAYTDAEKSGDRGVSVYRDRAHCNYLLGQIGAAEKDVKVALDKYPRNPFIVDLAAQIAIRQKNYKEAEGHIRDLETIEFIRENFYHRRATLRAAQKQFKLALEDATKAAGRNPPLHEILANKVDIEIELGYFDQAKAEMEHLEKEFKGRVARDVQLGLRCKLALRQGDWKTADVYYGQLQNKALAVHQGLRHEILKQKLGANGVPAVEEQEARQELAELEAKFKRQSPEYFLGTMYDDA